MNGTGRDNAPFSGRVWHEIDQAVATPRGANCTARRFLPIDGPYGLGLTSVVGDDQWLDRNSTGPTSEAWGVKSATRGEEEVDAIAVAGGGTYLVSGTSRPVPMILSDFVLGTRAIEAFESGGQPLDVCRATKAARDVALEEERLIYYGTTPAPEYSDSDQALLKIYRVETSGSNTPPSAQKYTEPYTNQITKNQLFDSLHDGMLALAGRGYAGPFALTVEPFIYSQLYGPVTHVHGQPIAVPVLLVDLLRNLFRGGVYMAPVIDGKSDASHRAGAIVTVGRAYSRLVVGQDWLTSYRGNDGVLHRFLIVDSLQFRICDPASIQVLTADPTIYS